MKEPKSRLSRRVLFAGAGTAGALATAAALLPSVVPRTEPSAAPVSDPPAHGGGYQLTEHVKRYYQTTRV